MCECALAGGTVTQPNLSAQDSSKAMTFATDFNRLAERTNTRACCLLLMPSKTIPGNTSIQLLGRVDVCQVVERLLLGEHSVYTGDHEQTDA